MESPAPICGAISVTLPPGACRMLGYDPEEVLGKNISDFFEGGSEDLTPIKRELKKNGELTHYEIALKTKQGGLRHLQPLRIPDRRRKRQNHRLHRCVP